jgi:hypothetical protein
MEKYFSFTRFFKFLKLELSEKIKFILKFAAILCLINISFWLLGKLLSYNAGGVTANVSDGLGYLISCYVLTIIVAPFAMYKNINHPKKGVDYASLPVSINEKFASMLLNTVVIAPLIVIAMLFCVDALMFFIDTQSLAGSLITSVHFFSPLGINVLIGILGIQALVIFGNTFFVKGKAVKTLLSIMLFYTIVVTVLIIIGVKMKENNSVFLVRNPLYFSTFIIPGVWTHAKRF